MKCAGFGGNAGGVESMSMCQGWGWGMGGRVSGFQGPKVVVPGQHFAPPVLSHIMQSPHDSASPTWCVGRAPAPASSGPQPERGVNGRGLDAHCIAEQYTVVTLTTVQQQAGYCVGDVV